MKFPLWNDFHQSSTVDGFYEISTVKYFHEIVTVGGFSSNFYCGRIFMKFPLWMVGWMDGWMDGWVDGWMDGWMDGWGGWMGGLMDGWMDGWVVGWMDGWTEGRQTDRQTYRDIIVSFYQLDAQILYIFNTFITFLYMFRALLCSSSGGQLY